MYNYSMYTTTTSLTLHSSATAPPGWLAGSSTAAQAQYTTQTSGRHPEPHLGTRTTCSASNQFLGDGTKPAPGLTEAEVARITRHPSACGFTTQNMAPCARLYHTIHVLHHLWYCYKDSVLREATHENVRVLSLMLGTCAERPKIQIIA